MPTFVAFFNRVFILMLAVNAPLGYLWLKYRILSQLGSKTEGKLLKVKTNYPPRRSRNYKTYTYSYMYNNREFREKETDYLVFKSDVGLLYPNKIEITYFKDIPQLSTVFNPTTWLRKKKRCMIFATIILNLCWVAWAALPLMFII